MPTKATTIRLDPALLTWVDSYAQERGANRTQIIEAAVRSFRDDARRGVPELPPPASSSPAGKAAVRKAVIAPLVSKSEAIVEEARREREAAIAARQERLNRAKYGRS